ncbi:BNR repeat domain protein [Labilithrix luteola]|uniref:BNR repeat domain protein n=2 Tax=Labilithrix luteola TaxID=1391654 RepID=A0A0K1PXQ3_9BACT|nr:BNR repeat domain protein [Labilithrix luteola]
MVAPLACSSSDETATSLGDDAEAPTNDAESDVRDAGPGTHDADADALPPPTYDFTIACTGTPCVNQLAARGGSHACAVLQDGTVRCWGANESGQLGTGLSDAGPMPAFLATPAAVNATSNAASVAVVGDDLAGTTCVVSTAGDVSCFGSDAHGQLGRGGAVSAGAHPEPVVIEGLKAKFVWLANTFALANSDDGRAWSWGANDSLQLARADGDTSATTSAAQAGRLAGPVRGFAGTSDNGFVVTETGTVLSWGKSIDSPLARASSLVADPVPAPLALSDIVGIASGTSHVCALSHGGGLFCWGANDQGQLGSGTLGTQELPAPVSLPEGVQAVAVFAGGDDTCIIAANGDLLCWGANDRGQLGVTAGRAQPHPRRIEGLGEQVVSAAIMDAAICALRRGGTVACWGDNLVGQLGRGSRDDAIHVEPGAIVFP